MARVRHSRHATHRSRRHSALKKKKSATRSHRARDQRVGAVRSRLRTVNAPKAW